MSTVMETQATAVNEHIETTHMKNDYCSDTRIA